MTANCRSRFLSVLITSMLAPFGSAGAAELSTVADFSITAQPLSTALIEFAKQANVQVLTAGYEVEGVGASDIAGRLTLDAALERMLKGSGFTYRFLDDKTLILIKEDRASAATSKALLLGQGEASGSSKEYTRLAQAQTGSQAEETAEANPSSTDTKGALEEIVVTAERREESIQSLPIAISAFSGEGLVSAGIANLNELQMRAPGLQVSGREGNHTNIGMRGIRSSLGGISDEPPVSLSQDGVPYTAFWQYNLDFFDVERVEVLRGPQGTISGRNATAGAINVYSKRPTETFEGDLKATIGNYDRLAIEGYLSGPIMEDRLLGRLAVRTDRDNGWITNTVDNQKLGTTDKTQVRTSLLAHIGDNFEATLIVDHIRDRSQPLAYTEGGRLFPDEPSLTEVFDVAGFDWKRRTVAHDQRSNASIEKDQVTLNMGWDLAPSARLTSTTGYVDTVSDFSPDLDGTPLTSLDFGNGPTRFTVEQVSQELTLTADLTDRLDMLLGALYLTSEVVQSVGLAIPVFGVPFSDVFVDYKLTSWAGYTQWRYRLTDDIQLTAGARYTHDTKRYNDHRIPFLTDKESWSAWTPRFAVDYTPTDDLTLYASVSRGFKSGGFASNARPLNPFNGEFVWSYEAGLKANWLDSRLNTALASFYMDYTDLQSNRFTFSEEGVRAEVTNADAATIKGVELEIEALVTDQFRISAGGTWLDATYDKGSFPDPLFPELGEFDPVLGRNFRDVSGNQLIGAPEWQFNISGEYRAPLPVVFLGGGLQGMLGASYSWRDKTHFDFFNNEISARNSYGLINLSAAIETQDAKWQLSAFVNNLTDKFYLRAGKELQTTTFFGVRSAVIQPGLPRTYGVSLAYRF